MLVIDHSPSGVVVYLTDGSYDATGTERWQALAEGLPGGLVLVDYNACADKAKIGCALVFDGEGNFKSELSDYQGPYWGLTLDNKGRLAIRPPDKTGTNLLPGQLYSESGYSVAGPIAVSELSTRWHRIQATVDNSSPNPHIQFFTYSSLDNISPSWPPLGLPANAELAGPGIWRPAPMDATDFLVLHEPAPFLWIGVSLQGDGKCSPSLHQIRLEFEHEGWLRHLPAIYARDESRNAFLGRTLALFESLLSNVESNINDLTGLFDPAAAPDDTQGSWLDWLSSWLAFEIEESWAQAKRRDAVASAFDILGRRGTVQGLRQFIAWYANIDVVIEEPARYSSVWSLGDNSTLGFTTMLATAEAQGAVLGTTATLNSSHLISEADYGAPLFEDLAHQFCVLVSAPQINAPGVMDALRRVIDREKPAHTSYQIGVVEPLMRVGLQARLGVDAIIGGSMPNLVLDAESELGFDTALATAKQGPGRIMDTDTRVGINIRLF